MIRIDNLTHIYPASRKRLPCTALSNFNLSVAAGTFCVLSGPNGSGKSTLFRILCGLVLPSSGSVTIGGHNLLQAPKMVRRIIGVVFQSPAVDKHLTVRENMVLHAALHLRLKDIATRVTEVLEWSELKNRLHHQVDTLSGGLARQLELAKCLLSNPKILLLDEPTTGLDPISRRRFLDVLKNLQRERAMTILMTTHTFLEAEEADTVAIMKNGHLLACDTPQRLRNCMGKEMIVVVPDDPAYMSRVLKREMGIIPLCFGDELRLEDTELEESLPLLEEILSRYRPHIRSIAIKQATLEDVFIHITSSFTPENWGTFAKSERTLP